MQADEVELYSIFKTSPLLTEATKLIVEAAEEGMSVSEIANILHKKAPTVHRALQKLRPLSLVSTRTEGRTITYRVLPGKKDVVQRILARLYYPTESFVIGELIRPSLNVTVKQNEEVRGMCFKHNIDIVYEYSQDVKLKNVSRVAIEVRSNLASGDVFAVVGRLFDIQAAELDGFLLVVVEDGTSRQSFSNLENFLNAVKNKLDMPTTAIFVEKKAPLIAIKEAQNLAASMLRR
jgi:hypothetical protein